MTTPSKRLHRRTWRTGAVLMTAALVAAACGSGDDDETSAPSGELVVWDFLYEGTPNWKETMDAADEQFAAEHPDVSVEHVAQTTDNAAYTQLIQSTFQAGEGPDVMMMQPGWDGVFTFADALTPLDDYFDDEFKQTIRGFEDTTLDGQTYGVPVGNGAIVIMYNKQLFQQAGLDPEAPPTTFDAILDAAETLKNAGLTPFAGGNGAGGDLSVWAISYLWPGAGTKEQAIALGENELKWTDPVVKAVLESYLSIYEKGYFADGILSDPIDAGVAAFTAGEAAMTILPASAMASVGAGIGGENVGFITSPGITEDTATYMPFGALLVWAVPQYSENKDLAAEYLELLLSADVQQQLYDKSSWLPANTDVDFESGDATETPELSVMMEAFATAEDAQLNVHQQIRIPVATELKRQMQSVMNGTTDLDAALEAIQQVQDQQVR